MTAAASTSEGIDALADTPICWRAGDTFNVPIEFKDIDDNGVITGITDLTGVDTATFTICEDYGTVLFTNDATIDTPTGTVTPLITAAETATLGDNCYRWTLVFDSSSIISTQMLGPWKSYTKFPPSV